MVDYEDENLFEIGSGVTSFTGGVWITSEPVLLRGSSEATAVAVLTPRLLSATQFRVVSSFTARAVV